jgi:hypothetical protein
MIGLQMVELSKGIKEMKGILYGNGEVIKSTGNRVI